ncbi:MAG TPA: NAD(P)/FAD-dependent oxidoreductase [Candidatus Krumholzibacteria bacterium]|nr:NAD(P)/FAD-dependent oxidoreductase [Candidatus Krumholzibacteria bacterium]
MKRTDTIIIGGGQAGLAMSRCLAAHGIDHAILERGEVAERWKHERWDSLHMLTPRWQSRLPGWSYTGPDPDGYMTRIEVIDYLERYARSFAAPIHNGVSVHALERDGWGFRVRTGEGVWHARTVVMATGQCDRPNVPSMAAALSPYVTQVTPDRYRNPSQLKDDGVLIVGASATGIQLASEIARSGRPVTLAVGRHTRLPRDYRGRDILAWFDAMGILTETTAQAWDVAASRRQPSLQLVGSDDRRSLDLDVLRNQGVRIAGRMIGAHGRRVYLADDIGASIDRAEVKMHEQLDRVDRFIAQMGIGDAHPAEDRPRRVIAPLAAPGTIDLEHENIRTVLWATGYRRNYHWLRLPVLDARGELIHDGGITAEPGLYALGLNFMRRRNSSFLDGVGADACELADHIAAHMPHRRMVAA